jgi:signal transduction histidine kinase
MPPDVHIAMYRIAQEALNNALKHARASQITLVLRRTDASNNGSQEPHHCVALTVRDNGRGFDPERVVGDHFGLGIMRERAQAIGATLTIESTPGMGTQISVLWEE